MSEGPPSPKKVKLDLEEMNSMTKEELISKLEEQTDYIKQLENKKQKSVDTVGDDEVKEEDKSKQQNIEALRRENTLVMRLTTKEQELQDCMNQIQEMKAGQTTSMAQLRTMLLDPAVNLIFQRITKEMEENKEKLKQTQNELSAWKFTPDSQTGKRLMVKCQKLLQENEELGKTIASGKTAKLEGEIALQKTLVTEMKKGQEEMDEFVADLEEDVEGMQSMIYLLQQQLKETKEQLAQLQTENEQLRKNLPQTNGVSMETDKPIVKIVIETKSEKQHQSTVDSSPVSCVTMQTDSIHHTSNNHIHSPTPVTTHDTIESRNDLDIQSNPEIEYSGNGDHVKNSKDLEEPMETDNIPETELKSEISQEESDFRTTATKNTSGSILKTIETSYDSSDTWSPPASNIENNPPSPAPVIGKAITDAQDTDVLANGIKTITPSEESSTV